MKLKVALMSSALVFCLLFFGPPANGGSPLSLSGTLHVFMPGSPQPLPAARYQMFLYSPRLGWSSPSFTDGHGRYAFYGVPPGPYLMRVVNYKNSVVWEQQVGVPSQVPPIVLPRP
jgi:hypothetical protein